MNTDVSALLSTLKVWGTTYTARGVVAVLILIAGIFLSKKVARLVKKAMERKEVDLTLIGFVHGLLLYSLIILVAIAAASQLGINTTSFLTIVGAAGLAIGLALKDTLSNFAAAVMLLLFRPFRAGDAISAAGVTGSVQAITLFNTILHTPDNQKILVPNTKIMGDTITNITANPIRRVDLVVGISYEDDIDQAKATLEKILAEDSQILQEPSPTVALTELANSSVNFAVRPWVKTQDYWSVRCRLIEKIKKVFDQEGISIPYPQQNIHLFRGEQTVKKSNTKRYP